MENASNISEYEDLNEDDESAWSCNSCPIRYLTALGIGVALAVLLANICNTF
jgi:hypothetical protein